MEKELWEQKKKFNLFISKEDVNDIIKVIKSVQNSGVLIDGVTETGKQESKKQEGGFLGVLSQSLAASVVQPVISSMVKDIIGRRVIRAGREYYNNMNKNF